MYTTNYIYKAPAEILNSLEAITKVLQEEATQCKLAATDVQNKQLKETMLLFVQETSQYSKEIICQIESMGGQIAPAIINNTPTVSHSTTINSLKDIGDYFGGCEKRILRIYRDMLNLPYMFSGLRQLIQYQQNGLLYLFQQFKILKATFSISA